ncbi:uncharacterized protein [Tursiops truncatus]|uniref:uncharacterized protein n=1 Tax=Tursiops truncatus TaxID=9739 RepID=UPI003CCF15F4
MTLLPVVSLHRHIPRGTTVSQNLRVADGRQLARGTDKRKPPSSLGQPWGLAVVSASGQRGAASTLAGAGFPEDAGDAGGTGHPVLHEAPGFLPGGPTHPHELCRPRGLSPQEAPEDGLPRTSVWDFVCRWATTELPGELPGCHLLKERMCRPYLLLEFLRGQRHRRVVAADGRSVSSRTRCGFGFRTTWGCVHAGGSWVS